MRISLSRFLLFSGLFVAGGMLLTRAGALELLQDLTASASGVVAGLLGERTTVLGSSIVTSAGTIDVIDGCLPVGMTAVFAALVISTETSVRRRVVGLGAVLAIVMVANVVRITAAIMAAQAGSVLFGYVHSGPLQMLPEALLFIPWLVWSGEEHRKAALRYAAYVMVLAFILSLGWPFMASAYGQLRAAALGTVLPASPGPQPAALSSWLVTGVAVLVAAKASMSRRMKAVSLLLVAVVAADLLLTAAANAWGVDQSLLRSSLTLMAPLVTVVLFVRGRLSSLWSGAEAAAV